MIQNKFQENQKPTNPCSIFAQYSGRDSIFKYYSKEQDSKLDITLPFYFVPLVQMWTVRGFNRAKNCGIFSNEVRSLKHEQLQIRDKDGVIYQGFYSKEFLPTGTKLFMSLYGVHGYRNYENKPQFELVCLKLKGTQISEAMDCKFKYDGEGFKVKPSEIKSSTFGDFTIPTFASKGYNETVKDKIQSFADQLFEYREQYVKYYSDQHSPVIPSAEPLSPLPTMQEEPVFDSQDDFEDAPF